MKEKIKNLLHKGLMLTATSFISLSAIFSSIPLQVHAANENVYFEVDKADEVLEEAERHLGEPYVWGAAGPNSFDCSGFVSYVFKQAGLKFNADRFTTSTLDSYLADLNVTSYTYKTDEANPKNAKAGDIILYYDTTGEAIHMGIYMGDGKVIHCAAEMPSGPQQQVMISDADALGTKHGTSIVSYKVYRVFPDKGSVRLEKTDEYGNALAGVKFKIFYPDGESFDVITNENGIWDSDESDYRLDPGSYQYQEISTAEGYLLDSTVRSFTVTAGVKASENVVAVTNNEPEGEIKVIKTNTNGDRVPDTVFKVYADETITNRAGSNVYYTKDQLVATMTTSGSGEASVKVPLGKYRITEYQVPTGYILNTKEHTVTLRYKDQETSVISASATIENEEQKGKVILKKSIDTSETDGKYGDACLQDNRYALIAKEQITNAAGTVKYYDKDQTISYQNTDAGGTITWDDLPLGKYYIKEISNNDSLQMNSSIVEVPVDYAGQTVEKTVVSKTTSDKPNMQKIRIFKSGVDGSSGVYDGLEGVEFTLKLMSDVDKHGWDNATTYDIISTDKKGNATTKYLPYGVYLVKETMSPANRIPAPDFTVSISKNYTDFEKEEQIKTINVNNAPLSAQVRLIKEDYDTGKAVTLNSASFKIKDEKGNYVVQKVGGIKIDTFTTNSKNQIVSVFGKQGEVTLPLKLNSGSYTIEEIRIPEGFLELEKPVTFSIENIRDMDKDEDQEPVISVKIKNRQPKGELMIHKSDKETGSPLENVEYSMIAKKDVINMIDGSTLFKAGEIVYEGKTDAKGIITVKNIHMGEYVLREKLTLEGYILSEDVHDIVFTKKDNTTETYKIDVDVTNVAPKGEIHLVKTDEDSSEFLSGVIYQLTAKEDIISLDGRNTVIYKAGDPVSMDISEDGRYMTDEKGEVSIAGLPLGRYELREIQALSGYYVDPTVYVIDLSYDHSDRTLYMKSLDVTNRKTVTEITKTDATDEKELEGAGLSLFDKDNHLIEKWTSGKEPHIIRGLLIGEKYRLHEDLAPLGYATASDVTFTIAGAGEATKVMMKDEVTKTEILKADIETNNVLTGAQLQVLEKDSEKIADQWISTAEAHVITGLHVGKTYILHEKNAPAGYHRAEDIEFTVADSGEVLKVEMKDRITTITVEKQDAETEKMLEGAMLSIVDKETGKAVDTWKSVKEPHVVKGLVAGKNYILKEISAPSHYEKAEDIEFTVAEDMEVQQIIMKDRRIPDTVVKTGDETNVMPLIAIAFGAGIAALVLYKKSKKQ
ncbi:NlpC/P60 family protein [[Clostridium] innocuum]|nr:NlpC/P60 family protein [[Clostridium] innocuum]